MEIIAVSQGIILSLQITKSNGESNFDFSYFTRGINVLLEISSGKDRSTTRKNHRFVSNFGEDGK